MIRHDGSKDAPSISVMDDVRRDRAGWLPWASVNLRRNPFGELTKEERVDVAVVDLKPIIDHLVQPRAAVQLIGDCGRGKTTRMLALRRRLVDASYTYLPEDAPCPAIAMGDPILIDEAQRLPRKVRRRIWESGCSLILATHRDLIRSLRKHDYTVVTISIGVDNTPALVCELLNRRIDASRLHSGAIPSVTTDLSEWLVSRFGTNIRAMEHFLYEQLQRQIDEHGQVRSFDFVG